MKKYKIYIWYITAFTYSEEIRSMLSDIIWIFKYIHTVMYCILSIRRFF